MNVKVKRLLKISVVLLFIALATVHNVSAGEDRIKIDKEHFGDEYFRYYIEFTFDKDEDGYLSEEERAGVTKIDVGEDSLYQLEYEYPAVKTLKGIEYFTNITELDCSDSELSKLDISKNTKLKKLNCSMNVLEKLNTKNNKQLEELYCNDNYIDKLNLTENQKIKALNYSGNKNIKVKGTNRLKKLERLSANRTETDKINISYYKNLKVLECNDNNLSKLNLKKNKKLQSLYCSGNKLKKLNLSKNKNLTMLACEKNQIKKLNLSHNRKLQFLYCSGNRMVTGNVRLGSIPLECVDTSIQKAAIRALKVKGGYLIPIKGVNKTNVITKLSKGKVTGKGILIKGKKVPKKITYQYNMFIDGDKNTKVRIKVKR